jgi:hypothetical protein
LRDFKNFHGTRLAVGKFTVIVGTNASGKSNIRDVFRFLHGIGRGYSPAEIIGGRYGAGGQAEWAQMRGAAKPLFGRLFAGLQRPNTKVVVCTAPLLQGVTEALKEDRLVEIIARYPMIDVFVLCVDRDGNITRRKRLDELERKLGTSRPFVAVNAREELETWVLAGLDLRKEWVWADIRRETSVKERYFEPLALE